MKLRLTTSSRKTGALAMLCLVAILKDCQDRGFKFKNTPKDPKSRNGKDYEKETVFQN